MHRLLLYTNALAEAIPCCTVEHLVTLQKLSFLLLSAKETVSDVTANMRKAARTISVVFQVPAARWSTCVVGLWAPWGDVPGEDALKRVGLRDRRTHTTLFPVGRHRATYQFRLCRAPFKTLPKGRTGHDYT